MFDLVCLCVCVFEYVFVCVCVCVFLSVWVCVCMCAVRYEWMGMNSMIVWRAKRI